MMGFAFEFEFDSFSSDSILGGSILLPSSLSSLSARLSYCY